MKFFERHPEDDPIMFWASRAWIALLIISLIGCAWSAYVEFSKPVPVVALGRLVK